MIDDPTPQTFCLLGLPVNVLDEAETIECIHHAASGNQRCTVSTPNVNFLVSSLCDANFHHSLIDSDINVIDGAPLVWLARRFGIPIKERVAGASVLERLVYGHRTSDERVPLRLFVFGGDGAAAQRFYEVVNTTATSRDSEPHVRCVGYLNPGFGTVDELSRQEVIDAINASDPDFLVVSLGAAKGQGWIMRNRHRLRVPVISHLGAAINFIGGEVTRAPKWVQRLGCEWLWRIKEEPKLVARYWRDGIFLIRLLATRGLPYWLWLRRNHHRAKEPLVAEAHQTDRTLKICLSGALSVHSVSQLGVLLSQVREQSMVITLDLRYLCYADAAGLGWLLALERAARTAGSNIVVHQCSNEVAWILRCNHMTRFLIDVE